MITGIDKDNEYEILHQICFRITYPLPKTEKTHGQNFFFQKMDKPHYIKKEEKPKV